MLSGVSTQEEAVSLRDRLSTGELIRILKTLQQTAAGFTRGGKNRLDGELCLIRLCEPALSLEPEAINARLTRLEEALASGARLHQAAPQAPEEEGPPLPDNREAPPEISEEEAVPQDTPVGFWTDLAARVRGAGASGEWFLYLYTRCPGTRRPEKWLFGIAVCQQLCPRYGQ